MTWLQQWTDALFVHYPVAEEHLRPLVPRQMEIDKFSGKAWLSYVFFRLKLRPAWLPFAPGFSSLVEMNVRTYVRRGGKPGIWFLRMYADNGLAIWASKWLTPLCYERAAMIDERLPDGTRRIECRPLDKSAGRLAAVLAVEGQARPAPAESLEAWLLERYRLFVARRDGKLLAAMVEHAPWEAAAVSDVEFVDGMSCSLGFSVKEEERVTHFSPGVKARFQGFESVEIGHRIVAGTAASTLAHAGARHGGR